MAFCLDFSKQTVANEPSSTQTTSGSSLGYDVSELRYLGIGIDVTAISGEWGFFVEGQGPDGLWYNIPCDVPFPFGVGKIYFAVGPGTSPQGSNGSGTFFPSTIRLSWDIDTGSITFSYWIVGQI